MTYDDVFGILHGAEFDGYLGIWYQYYVRN